MDKKSLTHREDGQNIYTQRKRKEDDSARKKESACVYMRVCVRVHSSKVTWGQQSTSLRGHPCTSAGMKLAALLVSPCVGKFVKPARALQVTVLLRPPQSCVRFGIARHHFTGQIVDFKVPLAIAYSMCGADHAVALFSRHHPAVLRQLKLMSWNSSMRKKLAKRTAGHVMTKDSR